MDLVFGPEFELVLVETMHLWSTTLQLAQICSSSLGLVVEPAVLAKSVVSNYVAVGAVNLKLL